ncbi:formate dehydrogenase-O [Escherichia coli]|uniref:Formate dehydrogenase-O n=1 Tax=Escherichia coli TaxID=562 RepID=A0A376VQC0_ECOLX|nr:formate dehydrogenase-O [Escherichia coli]
MAYQSQDIIRRSATNGPDPRASGAGLPGRSGETHRRHHCIGCKACQWRVQSGNDIRDTVGNNIGVYDNPNDLSAKSWTVNALLGSGTERQTGMADPAKTAVCTVPIQAA